MTAGGGNSERSRRKVIYEEVTQYCRKCANISLNMRKGFLIYEEMCEYLVINEDGFPNIQYEKMREDLIIYDTGFSNILENARILCIYVEGFPYI